MTKPKRALSADVGKVLKAWQDEGLVSREVGPEDFRQTITIIHDAATGHFDARAERMDAVQALGLLADVMAAFWRDGFRQPLRPRLNSGHAKVCIDLDGDTLSMAFGLQDPQRQHSLPVADPLVAKGMLVAALFGLCEETSGEGFNPAEALLGTLIVRT